ncbi:MAG TPA: ATP-binding protein [Ferruginibacter sp.]|nr:ATP-binding protein [Ferruginibacter sp.]
MSNDGFIGVTEPGTFNFLCINESGAKMFGYSNAEEFIKQHSPSINIVSTLSDKRITNDLRENADFFSEEVICHTKGDKEFRGVLTINSFKHNEKAYNLIRIIVHNKNKKYSNSLSEERGRLEALFNYATIGILVTNQQGEIVLINEFALKQFSYNNEEELIGQKIETLIPKRFEKKHTGHIEKYGAHPQARPMGPGMELYGLKKDNTEFPVEISLSNYKNEEGSFFIAFIIDISKRKEIEDTVIHNQIEIEKLNDELEEKVELRTQQLQETLKQLESSKLELTKALSKEKDLGDLKSRFVSMASHEFRTPLSTILSSVSLLAKYTQSDEQLKRDKHINRIKSSINNLVDILNEFLSLGKIEDGKSITHFTDFNLKTLLIEICSELKGNIKNGQHFEYTHIGDENVNLDASLLRNIIINLLSNAIKFSPLNGAIIITSSTVSDIIITVKDNGIGISKEDQKHLFELFFRGNNATNIEGTGLGLHIVAKYVELMNGHIDYTSELGKGTTFTIKFI